MMHNLLPVKKMRSHKLTPIAIPLASGMWTLD